ncbi:MAG TPA: TonB-dependent receptor, partial [Bryobacteraceae bacterium]|nr:TonB-dependent receptor [Bryobacteraceae bacterium]
FLGNTSWNSFGQRGQDNGFLLDGVDNNSAWVRGAGVVPPMDSVAAVSMLSGYIPAEFGHAAGAVARMETRAGADAFHGDAFETRGQTALDARNFFDTAGKPPLGLNQFGGAAGGAILPRKWYFFIAPEARRESDGVTVTSTVPTKAEKGGDFSESNYAIYDPLSIHSVGENLFARDPFPNNRIPAAEIPQAARNLAALYPDPNGPGLADNYAFVSRRMVNSRQFALRSDYAIAPASRLAVRLVAGSADGQEPGALPAPSGMGFPAGSYAGSDSAQNADAANTHETWLNGAASFTRVISASLTNTARAAIAAQDLHATAADQGFDASTAFGIPGLGAAGMPSFSVLGFASLGASSDAPFALREASYQIEDAVAGKTGRHSWKFGFQAIRRNADGDASDYASRAEFFFSPDYTSQPGVANTGDSIASLLLGFPEEVRRDVQYAPYQLRAWEWAGFAQDSFRLTRRFTVEAGLRYSQFPPLTEARNRMVNFNFNYAAPALNQYAGQNGVNADGGAGAKRALAPRVGFALDLADGGPVVLRGSFSQAWDAPPYLSWGALARNAPYAERLDIVNGTFQVGANLTAGMPPASAGGAFYALEPGSYTPYSDQWRLSLETRLRHGLVAQLSGLGSMGIHLPSAYNANQPYPAPTPYPYPRYPYKPLTDRIDYLGFAGGSTYYAGTAQLSGPLFQIAYTYGKSIDDSVAPSSDQASRPPAPQDIYYPRGARGLSPFDVAQRLSATAHYEVRGFRVFAIATVQSGLPFTPQLAANSLNNGGFQLPNRLAGGTLGSGQRNYLDWFNTNAFAIPNLYQFGNSGYGILRGPGMANLDGAVERPFALGERVRITARVEAYNLANRTNLALPNRILGLESSGAIDHTVTDGRRLQLAARLEW